MRNFKIEKHRRVFSSGIIWRVITQNDKMSLFIDLVIYKNKLPYIQDIETGSYCLGGMRQSFLDICISTLADDDDFKELEEIITNAANDCVIKSTRHRKKLTTFLPRRGLRWSTN